MSRAPFVLVAALFPLVAGCDASSAASHSLYWTPIHNAPALSHKGEVAVAVYGTPIQSQLNLAWAPTGHLAVRAAADVNFVSTAASGDVGVGWFDAESAERGWRVGIAGDVGAGSSRDEIDHTNVVGYDCGQPIPCTQESTGTSIWQTTFARASIQGEAGEQFEKYYVGGAARVSGTKGTLKYDYSPASSPGNPPGSPVSEKEDANWVFVDAVGILRTRFSQHVAFEGQLGITLPIAGVGPVAQRSTTEGEESFWPIVFALGLHVNF